MRNIEIKAAATFIIRTSSSEEEVRIRLRNELQYEGGIGFTMLPPGTDYIEMYVRNARAGNRGSFNKAGWFVTATMTGHGTSIYL